MTKGNRHKRRHDQRFHRQTLPGAPAGTIDVDPAAPRPIVHAMAYGPGPLVEQRIDDLAKIEQLLREYAVVWVNVDGLGDAETIRGLGRIFGIHPLALEDVVHVHQRPKVEDYSEHLFLVARMVELAEHLTTEQVSLFLGRKFVLTFLEDPGDSFDPVRNRLRAGHQRTLSGGAPHLAYALLDAVIDAYFPVVEEFGDRMEVLEDEIILRPDGQAIARIHELKRDLRTLRRAVWPLREAVGTLSREVSPLMTEETRVYLRDCYDHTVQIIDLVETYRELGADLTDLYLSSQSHRMNEVMKVLTIIATVFMPLGFIAGVYGMNFEGMPELHWAWGYPFALSLMAAVTGSMLYFFYRKEWLGSLRPDEELSDEAKSAMGQHS